ncbi:MAG: hypothetical protein KatS3mg076_2833 [Candidatus Binatia bacterium]|nr:MAG: hypothetical protein KatS3mg076_2833 [Candidatus Binatia bacterium]
MIVVDTSVWIAFFRGADSRLVGHLRDLLDRDDVLLAAPVRLELLSGAPRRDYGRLDRLLTALPVAYPTEKTWERLDGWVRKTVEAGERFGFADLLIAALAADEKAAVWSLDRDFRRLGRLGFVTLHTPS